MPTLHSQCIQVLKENVDFIDKVGDLQYDILKPVLEMASDKTLMRIEDSNQHLMKDTGELWEKLVKKHFFNKKREEMESPREMYERCTRERDLKFEKIKRKMKETVRCRDMRKVRSNPQILKNAFVDYLFYSRLTFLR